MDVGLFRPAQPGMRSLLAPATREPCLFFDGRLEALLRSGDFKFRKHKSPGSIAIFKDADEASGYVWSGSHTFAYFLQTDKGTLTEDLIMEDITCIPSQLFISNSYLQYAMTWVEPKRLLVVWNLFHLWKYAAAEYHVNCASGWPGHQSRLLRRSCTYWEKSTKDGYSSLENDTARYMPLLSMLNTTLWLVCTLARLLN